MEHKGVEYTVVQMADGAGWDGKSGLTEAKPNPV
jgi:hypothetical protein